MFSGDTTSDADRITCATKGLPPTSCNSLGRFGFSLVPFPAAMMAMAKSCADMCPWYKVGGSAQYAGLRQNRFHPALPERRECSEGAFKWDRGIVELCRKLLQLNN